MAARREQGFYSTLVSVLPWAFLPNFETEITEKILWRRTPNFKTRAEKRIWRVTLTAKQSLDPIESLKTYLCDYRFKKKRPYRSLAIANVASERKRALIEIIRKSSRLLSVSDCLSSQEKKLLPIIPVFCGERAVESAGKYSKWLDACGESFYDPWCKKEGYSLSFSLLIHWPSKVTLDRKQDNSFFPYKSH